MKLGISAFAGDGGKSGISQYMINIFRHLPELTDSDEFVLFMSESDREFFETDHPRVRIVTSPDWVAKPVVNILWHLFILPLMLRRYSCDCVFMPAANRRLAWSYGVPSIGTVHDLSQLHVKAKYDPFRMFYVTRLLPKMMRRLTHIITVSRASKNDVVDHVGYPAENIDVVYNGADMSRFKPMERTKAARTVREKFGIDAPYILYTARLEHPGKNHVRLLEAFAQMKKETGLPHKLVCAGSAWHGAEAIYAKARELGIQSSVFFPGFVANSELPLLYAAADLFVFPSLFEGFGIPPLEAMASGTAVCGSKVSSIPEVIADAGLLFDPENPREIRESMAKLLKDDALRAKLVHRGLRRSCMFSWKDSARHILSICRAVLASSEIAKQQAAIRGKGNETDRARPQIIQ